MLSRVRDRVGAVEAGPAEGMMTPRLSRRSRVQPGGSWAEPCRRARELPGLRSPLPPAAAVPGRGHRAGTCGCAACAPRKWEVSGGCAGFLGSARRLEIREPRLRL